MDLLFLGTAGYHPNESRQTTCLFLPEAGVVLDAGTGFFRLRQHWAGGELAILLSHLHLDHTAGLTYLLDVLWGRPASSVTIYGPVNVAELQHGLFGSPLFPVPLEHPVVAMPAGGIELAGARVTSRLLPHPGGSLAYRLDWPERSLAYVTDTTASLDYADFVRGVDLLVHECNFPDRLADVARRSGHSYTSAVCELALTAGVKRLALMHFNPLDESDHPAELDRADVTFPGAIEATDGIVVGF